MFIDIIKGLMIPFIGTFAGSACVLFMKKTLNTTLQRSWTGFAAGFTLMLALDVALG